MKTIGRRGMLKTAGWGTVALGVLAGKAGAQTGTQKRQRRNYRVAVIGATGQGGYGHGLHIAFQNVERAKIVAVADSSEMGGATMAARLNLSQAYRDYRRMLQVEKPDIVCVCPGWLDRRVEMVTAAAEAGAHIYCEKPFTSTLHAADQMYDACRKAGIKLAMAHQWAAMAPVQRIMREIRDGKHGKLLRVYIRPKDDARGGGHELILHGTHHFDLLFAIAGLPRWVFGNLQVNGRDVTSADRSKTVVHLGPIAGDSVSAMIGFDHGIRGFFDSTANLAVTAERPFDNLFGIMIECEKRRIHLRPPGDAYLYPAPTVLADIDKLKWEKMWIDDWHYAEDRSLRPIRRQWLHMGNTILANDLIDAIEQDREPISGIDRAMLVTEVVQGVYASHFTAQRVSLPLKHRMHPLEENARERR